MFSVSWAPTSTRDLMSIQSGQKWSPHWVQRVKSTHVVQDTCKQRPQKVDPRPRQSKQRLYLHLLHLKHFALPTNLSQSLQKTRLVVCSYLRSSSLACWSSFSNCWGTISRITTASAWLTCRFIYWWFCTKCNFAPSFYIWGNTNANGWDSIRVQNIVRKLHHSNCCNLER